MSYAEKAGLLLALVAALSPRSARAGPDTHYQDLVVGERAAGMGGAFTALADEATGLHYNPAGMIQQGSVLLQLSMSAYKLRHSSVEIAEWCGRSFRHSESSFFSFPGSFGVVTQLPGKRVRHALGLAVIFPHAHQWSRFYVDDAIPCGPLLLGASEAFAGFDRELRGGVAYALEPWPFLRLGVALWTSARSVSAALSFDQVTVDASEPWHPESFLASADATIWSLCAQVGVILLPRPDLRVGLSLSSPYLALAGRGSLTLVNGQPDPADWRQTTALHLTDVDQRWKVPFQVALGVAYLRRGRLALAADVKLHGPVDRYTDYDHPDLPEWFSQQFVSERRLVVNGNLGLELLLGRLALRGGFFTNFSSSTREERVHLYGGTLGGTVHTRKGSTLSMALQVQVGSGTFPKYVLSYEGGEYRHREEEVDVRDLSLILTLGGSFDIR
jgi:long-chain fatty acid transport protein